MHRTNAENATSGNLYQDGPPGTRLGAAAFNSIQEELAYAIEQAGLTVQTVAADDYQQLKAAIEILGQAAAGMPATTRVWFHQVAQPTGWTIDTTIGDTLLAIRDKDSGGLAYDVAGGTTNAGTWTQPNHTHGVGTFAFPNHSHSNGTLALAHTHGVGTFAFPDHIHTDNFTTPVHTHTDNLTVDNHTHVAGTLSCSAHQHALTGGTPAGTFAAHTHTLSGAGEAATHWHTIANGTYHSDLLTIAETVYTVAKIGSEMRVAQVGAGSVGSYESGIVTDSTGPNALNGVTDSTMSTNALAGNTGNATPTIGGSTGNNNIGTISGSVNGGGNGVAIAGSVSSSGGAAITGASAAESTSAVTGSTASDGTAAITGTSANGRTAITYRPLAQVGIICTKD